MDPVSAIIAFSIAAALMTLTPGLDTALVLRTATVEGPKQAFAAGLGISAGVITWGFAASVGLGALLAVSEAAYRVMQFAGAAYLIWLGFKMLRAALRPADPAQLEKAAAEVAAGQSASRGWFWRGLMTNLLNPKVGVFYVSFLPQFIPADVPVTAFSTGLAAIHGLMGVLWFAVIILATRPIAGLLRRPSFTRGIDGLTGSVLIAFGLRLALERRS